MVSKGEREKRQLHHAQVCKADGQSNGLFCWLKKLATLLPYTPPIAFLLLLLLSRAHTLIAAPVGERQSAVRTGASGAGLMEGVCTLIRFWVRMLWLQVFTTTMILLATVCCPVHLVCHHCCATAGLRVGFGDCPVPVAAAV